jgi:hypothetical protein
LGAQQGRPIAPHAHAAQAFMQKHEGWRFGPGRRGDAQNFKAYALNAYFLKGTRLHLNSRGCDDYT